MALSFNNAPYWDDYDQTKGFLKILFKPGFAVQARELTQVQDILQNQIGSFGSFVFKSGSPVLGGQITLDTNVTYANLNPLFSNNYVNINQFVGNVITDVNSRTIRASVIAANPQLGSNPPTLMLKYLTGITFANGANVVVENSNNTVFGTFANTNFSGPGSCASVSDGVFFLDLSNLNTVANANANTVSTTTNAYFVRVPQQTIILDPYDNTPTYSVGLQISDSIVTVNKDTSLLDPALGSSNYLAPGADRYLINAVLSTRQPNSTDLTSFIQLLNVANGQVQSITSSPQLSQILTTMAKRTYDQSGSFTVKPFRIQVLDTANSNLANANTQMYYAYLGPGNAYVDGYQYQTLAKTFLSAPKPRTIANVSNYNLQTYFGNYILLDTVQGEFNFTTLPSVDLHCVPASSVNTTNNTTYYSSLIGTAKLRSFEYNNAANTSNALNYVFRTGLFFVNTSSISLSTISSTATTVTLANAAQTLANAYAGMTLVVPSTGDSRFITSYNGATQTATVSSAFSVNPSSGATVNIIGNVNSIDSIGLNTSSGFLKANGNINIGSKNTSNLYQYASLSDTNFNNLIFKLPNSTIAQGLQNPSYEYRTLISTNQTLSPGVPLVVNLNIIGDPSATFASGNETNSDLLTLTDFLLVTNPISGSGGQIIPMVAEIGRNVSTTTTTATFTTAGGDPTFTNVDIYASIKTTIGAKTKTIVTGNTTIVANTSGTSVANSTVYTTQGQVYFNNPFNTNLVIQGATQDLYISDGINIVAIIDSGALSTNVSIAMITAAINGSTMPGSSQNLTNSYTFNNGQKDSLYDHCNITLNPGGIAPKGQVLVILNYFSPSTTGGYFSVDSYPNYTTIPVYNSTSLATTYFLRDCLDWRPVRDSATTAYTFTNQGPIFLPEPIPANSFNLSYGYYLGRVDYVVLTSSGNFNVVQGSSSLNPQPPSIPKNSMLLYTLVLPPYTFYAANVIITQQNNQRYTMADIGKLEKRIQTLEYYNALSQAEQAATNQTITDSNGVVVPQLGLLVDSFTGSSIANILSPDYAASIDGLSQQLRPSFAIGSVPLTFAPENSSNYVINDHILTLPFFNIPFISQNSASRIENVNPFNVTNWYGTLSLTPSSDTWISQTSLPAVTTNLSGDNDAYQAATSVPVSLGTNWNSWQTIYTGVSTQTTVQNGAQFLGSQTPGVYVDAQHAALGAAAYTAWAPQTTTTTTTTTQDQTRTGIQSVLSTENITIPVGDKLISTSVIPYMRSIPVSFVSRGMKPLTNVYAYFDNVNVTPYTLEAGIITFTGNTNFQDSGANSEIIFDTDGGTNSGIGANSAQILLSKGNIAYVSNVVGVIYPGKTFQGTLSGNTGIVSSYSHVSGFSGELAGQLYQKSPFVSGTTQTVTTTSIVLQGSASNVNNYYVGNSISIATGTNMGISSTITSYNGASRIATVNPWNVTAIGPYASNAVNSSVSVYYTIGNLNTDSAGDICGTLIIPNSSTVEFPTGTATFQLTDSPLNNPNLSTTSSVSSFISQGTLETVQPEYVSTTIPVLTQTTVTQSQVLTSSQTNSTTQDFFAGYVDPLAQTFLIDPTIYPNGVFLTSLRLCFFAVDPQLPVSVEIRPVDNGFPSSSNIVPGSQVTLLPSQCNVSTSPSIVDPTQYTEFDFNVPIFLNAGYEFAIVIKSNSNNYEVYTAAVGDKTLGSNQLISKPPYLGVLFKSQNASTWTPFQGESLMFSLQKAVFNNSTSGFATFKNPQYNANNPAAIVPSSSVLMDTMYVTNNDQTTNNTTLSYSFRGTSNSTLTLDSSYSTFIPNQNYSFANRYNIQPSYGSFWVQTQLTSSSSDISPIVDLSRYSVMGISNIINNGSIGNTNIVINNPGVGYNIANTNIFTVTGNTGSGLQLAIGSTDTHGNITSVIIPNGQSGSLYSLTPNVSLVASGYSPSVNASISINGETNSLGGNFLARYMTRSVTLASGVNAGNLQVWVDEYLPQGTNIFVYYKILSALDPTPFAQRPWVLMQVVGTQSVSTIPNSFTTYQYVGAVNQYGNPVNQISYGSYNTFNQFAVKIVMSTNNPSIVPICKNLRVYALPASS